MHRRGTTWTYVIDVGRDPSTGRRRQRTKGGFRVKRDAERAMAEMLQTLDEGTYVARDPQTLGEWIERWLETMKPKIRESTWRDYRNGLHRVSDRLGQVPLQSLRPLDVEELYADLLREGRRYGGGLAPKTVRNIHIALRRSLADALRFGLVSRNVAALVKPPVPGRSELVTWSADEVRAFLDAVGDDRLMPAYRLLAATGMRRGEALGLRWSDVDLAKSRLTVNRALTVVDSAAGVVVSEDVTVASQLVARSGDGCGAARASQASSRGKAGRGPRMEREQPGVLHRARGTAAPGPVHPRVWCRPHVAPVCRRFDYMICVIRGRPSRSRPASTRRS